MIGLIIQVVVNAIALVVAAAILPQIHLPVGKDGNDWIQVGAVALIFALVNSFIKPTVKALSLPFNMMSLGLFTFVINAVLLVLVAWLATDVFLIKFTIGTFPPTLNIDTIIGAVLGSIIISIVSTGIGLATLGKAR